MNNVSKLTEILRDAISDYASNADKKELAEWLQGYLSEKMPNKSIDKVHSISSEIINTLNLVEEKKAALDAAVKVGESTESWFAKETMKGSNGNAEKARMAAEFLNGITNAEQSYDSNYKGEIIDVDAEVWTDDKWNDYRLKDTLKGVAAEAGKAGLREIASDAFIKASEDGIASVLEDSEFIQRSIEKGAITGVKVAVSAGLSVAQESGFIPPSSFQVIAVTAHKTVESFTAFGDVIRGQKTMTEALIEIKNTAVSTFSAMWTQYGSGVITEIKEVITDAFGLKGAVISGAVNGLLTPPQESTKLVHVLKETGKAVWSFLNKEIQIPFLNKIKNKLFN